MPKIIDWKELDKQWRAEKDRINQLRVEDNPVNPPQPVEPEAPAEVVPPSPEDDLIGPGVPLTLYREVYLTEKEDANATEPSEVVAGGRVVITLDEEPELNLKWVIESTDSIFVLEDESKKDDPGPFQRRLFRFRVDDLPGQGKIVLGYRNPWKKNEPSLRTVDFDITSVAK